MFTKLMKNQRKFVFWRLLRMRGGICIGNSLGLMVGVNWFV